MVNPSSEFLKARKEIFNKGYSLDEIDKEAQFLPKQTDINKYSSKFSVLSNDGNSIQQSGSSDKENPIRRYEFRNGISYGDLFGAYLKTYGENLFTIVQVTPKLGDWINSFYDEYKLEFLIDFSSRIFEIQKKQKGIVYKIPFELTPDTFRRMLFHVAAIYSNRNTTILLEEPESHSFPPYVKELSELIKADKQNTYFVTTHSPYFFNSMVEDSKKIKDISFFHVYYDDYQTKIKRLTQKELDNIWGNGADVFFNIDSLNR
jgi:hypothetical protein